MDLSHSILPYFGEDLDKNEFSNDNFLLCYLESNQFSHSEWGQINRTSLITNKNG
jgi:hypothetical protein